MALNWKMVKIFQIPSVNRKCARKIANCVCWHLVRLMHYGMFLLCFRFPYYLIKVLFSKCQLMNSKVGWTVQKGLPQKRCHDPGFFTLPVLLPLPFWPNPSISLSLYEFFAVTLVHSIARIYKGGFGIIVHWIFALSLSM